LSRELEEDEVEILILLREQGCRVLGTPQLSGNDISLYNLESGDLNPASSPAAILVNLDSEYWTRSKEFFNSGFLFVLESDALNYTGRVRRFAEFQIQEGSRDPVLLRRRYSGEDINRSYLEAAYELGGPLLDGFGEGIWCEPAGSVKKIVSFSFKLLQATRLRVTGTDYISCPSCGRTLFDLQTTTQRIRSKTSHLKGVKIAIMGCIVNGPGEMADADFGYVGAAPGKVNLYVGKELIERGVEEQIADERLIELIRKHGKWVENENLEKSFSS